MRLILASTSPRRRELLTSLGLPFTVEPGVELDEAQLLAEWEGELAQRLVRLAQLKGDSVAQAHPGDVVLSADTAVVADGAVLGKPADAADAARMLRLLSGREHEVLTAVAVQRVTDSLLATGCEATRVEFHELSEERIARYLAADQPYDKAGAYAIQGIGALLVRGIRGEYSNVVGLPMGLTTRLLACAGFTVL